MPALTPQMSSPRSFTALSVVAPAQAGKASKSAVSAGKDVLMENWRDRMITSFGDSLKGSGEFPQKLRDFRD